MVDQGWSMAPLTVEDLLPLEVYAPRRREFFDSHRRYIDRCRRVRIGPRLTLIFENRQTLWFRVQEIVRVARLSDRRDVEQELGLYNRLMPDRNLLQAALLIDSDDTETAILPHLQGDQLGLLIGGEELPAKLLTRRTEDQFVGNAHWVQFEFNTQFRDLLNEMLIPAYFQFDNGRLQYRSAALSSELRQSLIDDLGN